MTLGASPGGPVTPAAIGEGCRTEITASWCSSSNPCSTCGTPESGSPPRFILGARCATTELSQPAVLLIQSNRKIVEPRCRGQCSWNTLLGDRTRFPRWEPVLTTTMVVSGATECRLPSEPSAPLAAPLWLHHSFRSDSTFARPGQLVQSDGSGWERLCYQKPTHRMCPQDFLGVSTMATEGSSPCVHLPTSRPQVSCTWRMGNAH